MIPAVDKFYAVAICAAIGAMILNPLAAPETVSIFAAPLFVFALAVMLGLALWFSWKGTTSPADGLWFLAAVGVGGTAALVLLYGHGGAGKVSAAFWVFIVGLWALAWRGIDCLAAFRSLTVNRQRFVDVMIPVLFGAWLLFLWEVIVAGFEVPHVLLPPPSSIAARFVSSLDILRADFYQTFMKAVLAGYVLGCASGFAVAVLVDRVAFLKRGLLPLGNLVSALPIVGVAPIMVMWFGFDWQSKAAVVVIMTFFPMLVNTVTGLSEAGALEKDLMRSYGAGYWQNLFKLRLPVSLPFIFNALKINSTLAMIGAIVAEFFGTPIVGMGFRISTEVGRMNVDMVWAEIVVAAIAGSMFYGVMALLERKFTFWHASYRHLR